MKPFEGINRKKIIGVPALVIFLVMILIRIQSPNEESETKLKLIKQLLAFTHQDEYPDCSMIDLFAEIKEGQRTNDNLYLEPSHSVRFRNDMGPEVHHYMKGIDIDKLNIAELVEYLINIPGSGIDCSLADSSINNNKSAKIQVLLFTQDFLRLDFQINKNLYLTLKYNGEKRINLESLNIVYTDENRIFEIRLINSDAKIVQIEKTSDGDVIELSLNQLLNGDFTSVWGENVQEAINSMRPYIQSNQELMDIIEKLGLSENTREIFNNYKKLIN